MVRLERRADHYVFHGPLDLCVGTILREAPLLHVLNKVGHIDDFTKAPAVALLEECGFSGVDYFYTGAGVEGRTLGWKTQLGRIRRRNAYAIDKDAGVRLLVGETLMVLAEGPASP